MSSSLVGKKVVFTGFRDIHLADTIKKLGGIVTTSVSIQTDIVIYEGEKGKNSDKKAKGQHLGKIVITKKSFLKTYIENTNNKTNSSKGFWAKLFAPKKNFEQNKRIVPKYDTETIVKEPCKYLIHDNGGRPFEVCLTNKQFSVYKQSQTTQSGKDLTVYTDPYDKVVIKPTSYKRVFVGKCPDYGKRFDGNSILVHVKANDYIYIGSVIYKITLDKDTIIGYKSPVGNSDVPYPYAYGSNKTYLFLEKAYIPNDILNNKDPYQHYYDLDKKQSQKYKFKTTLVHKRM
jgi:hypothetical protein